MFLARNHSHNQRVPHRSHVNCCNYHALLEHGSLFVVAVRDDASIVLSEFSRCCNTSAIKRWTLFVEYTHTNLNTYIYTNRSAQLCKYVFHWCLASIGRSMMLCNGIVLIFTFKTIWAKQKDKLMKVIFVKYFLILHIHTNTINS